MQVSPHLSGDELRERMMSSETLRQRLRWQVIFLAQQGQTSEQIAQTVGYSSRWVLHLVALYSRDEPEAIVIAPHVSRGPQALLTPTLRAELGRALEEAVPDSLGGGLWNGVKVAAWLSARLGRPVHRQRGHEALRALGYSCQHPRPRHVKADPAQQEAFKKVSSTRGQRQRDRQRSCREPRSVGQR